MPLQPDPPFPKGRGDALRAEDWNETVNEVIRLDQSKLNQSGGTVAGNLAVTGTFSAGTISGTLAANSVTTDKIANSAVSSAKPAPGAVNGTHIAPRSVGLSQLAGFLWFDFTFSTAEEIASQNIAVVLDEDVEGDLRGYQLFTVGAEYSFTVKHNGEKRETRESVRGTRRRRRHPFGDPGGVPPGRHGVRRAGLHLR